MYAPPFKITSKILNLVAKISTKIEQIQLTMHQGEERTDININTSQTDKEFGIIVGKQFGIKSGDNDMRVLLLLNSNPTFSSQKIADRLEITKRAVEKIIKRLRENSVIERIGSSKSDYWKINRIDEKREEL